jgi:hypothetical protein
VLRITSGDVALWMHYDVFDNLLYQVGGDIFFCYETFAVGPPRCFASLILG